jgi:hypothetical protein
MSASALEFLLELHSSTQTLTTHTYTYLNTHTQTRVSTYEGLSPAFLKSPLTPRCRREHR